MSRGLYDSPSAPPMMIVQHVLVIFLVVGTPLWDWYAIPRLKASTNPRKKVRFYRLIVISSWVCAAIAVATVGFGQVFRSAGTEVAWLNPRVRMGALAMGLIAGMFLAIFVPAVLALRSEKIRVKAAKAAKKLSFILPSSGEERRWWWLVCITAGICEEIVYRGFLLHYFQVTAFHLSLTLALVVSSVIFGIGHLYQGVAGGLSTVVIGFVMGILFVMTGNLLLPMVLHAVMDLRVLAILPEGFETAEISA